MRSRPSLAVVPALVAGLLLAPPAAAVQARIFTVAASTHGASGQVRDGAIATEAGIAGDVAVAPDGSLLIADSDVWRVGLDGRLARVAGSGREGFGGDGGRATAARVSAQGVAVMADGSILIVDRSHHRIRRVSSDGTISTVAGSGPTDENRPGGFAGDGGPATAARLNFPADVAAMADGGFLIADAENERVRRVWPDGTITTVAGMGFNRGARDLGDGRPATAASLDTPSGVAAMPDGGFLIADTVNDRIRRVAPDGTISTLAGTGPGFSGDGGRATAAELFEPRAVAVAPSGEVLIADSSNDRVRGVGRDGRIFTVAGSGDLSSMSVHFNGALMGDGGPAMAAFVDRPASLAVTPEGGLFVASADGVRFVAPRTTPTLAVAVLPRSGRASRGGYRGRVITTVPAHVTVEARGTGGRVRTEGDTAAGSTATLALVRRLAPGIYSVTATATTDAGAVATNATRLILGGTLPRRIAKRAADEVATPGDAGEDDHYAAGRCHRFSERRVDCEIKYGVGRAPTSCGYLIAVRLTASGLLRGRDYLCPRHSQRLFRRIPRWQRGQYAIATPSHPRL